MILRLVLIKIDHSNIARKLPTTCVIMTCYIWNVSSIYRNIEICFM